jgi:serine/threonine protein kinase
MELSRKGLKRLKTYDGIVSNNDLINESNKNIRQVFQTKPNKKKESWIEKKFVINTDKDKEKQCLEELKINYLISLFSEHLKLVSFDYVYFNKNEIFALMPVWDNNLYQILNSKIKLNFSPTLVKYIMFQCCFAMKSLHDLNIIHKDIKPANILINDTYDLAFCDYGVSNYHYNKKIKLQGEGHTIIYSPYEYVKDKNGFYDSQYDVFSLGLVFYELFLKFKIKKFPVGPLFQPPNPNNPKEDIKKQHEDKFNIKK